MREVETMGHALGRAIRTIRQARKLTLVYVEGATGLSSGNLSRVERGEQGISMESLAAVAKALGVSVVDLFTFAETENKGPRQLPLTGPVTLAVPCFQFAQLGTDESARDSYYTDSPTSSTFAVVLTGMHGFDRLFSLSKVTAVCDSAITAQPKDLVVVSVNGAAAIGEFRVSAGNKYLVPVDGLPPVSLEHAHVLGVVRHLVYERHDKDIPRPLVKEGNSLGLLNEQK